MRWKDLYHNKWVRMGFWSLLYVLWVIWLGNGWWLLGLVVIFDSFITKKTKKQKRNLDHFAILDKADVKRVKELLVI